MSNKFIIQFEKNKHNLCLLHIDDPRFNNCDFNSIDNIKKYRLCDDINADDLNTLIVCSSELTPIVFYQDNDYLRCIETNKYICALNSKFECRGGSILFLSHNKYYAVVFGSLNIQNINEKEYLYFIKSLGYPGYGHDAGLICPRGKGTDKYKVGSTENGPVIAYHIEPVAPLWKMKKIDIP
jgi:hypothetical protein